MQTVLRGAGCAAALFMLGASAASAATLRDDAQLVAATRTARALQPDTATFEVAAAGNYRIRLKDENFPALLSALRAIVVHDLDVVADVELTYAGGTPPSPASDAFSAAPGTYHVLVLGEPGVDAGGDPTPGQYSIAFEQISDGAPLAPISGEIDVDEAPPAGVYHFQSSFITSAAGDYTLTMTDHAFPAALQLEGVLIPPAGAPTPFAAGDDVPFSAAAGAQYNLVVIDRSAPQAGLFSLSVTGPGAAPAFLTTQRLGGVSVAQPFSVPAAGDLNVTLSDAEFGGALSSMQIAVVQSGALRGTAAGDATIGGLTADSAQLFAYATTSSVGALRVRLEQNGGLVFGDVIAFDGSADPASPAIYSFAPSQPVAAGGHIVTLTDFRFPSAFADLDAAVVQDDELKEVLSGQTAVLATGPVKMLVATRFGSIGAANGMFGLKLQQELTEAIVLESTQGVGGLFRTETLNVPAAGAYDIQFADLQFPVAMRTNALAISRDAALVGQIFGGGTLSRQQLAPGVYVFNLLTQPAANEQYGAYAVKVADSPPTPVVTLSASPAAISSGGASTLQWSAMNATACTASGAWSGSKQTSGQETTGALNANASYELRCTGPGGSATATATVTVNPPSRNGGGGGAFGALLIYMCAGLALASARRARPRR